ncbi:transposase [Rhizobium mongolense]|uniref:Transposase n=1 Tax=Rhizobium mongolense TaxID=57676 RepID=A0ABR6IZE5_9HYPH|nr:transposase [Rhizobium mongolense]MBB4233272.1 transposase [Rhizobium mongolense]
MDILDDRSVASVAQWLKRHPNIEVVSRDRCGLYAQAAREGAPQASQLVDRFHLIQNLRHVIEEQMNLCGRATDRALLLTGTLKSKMTIESQGAIGFAARIGSPGRMCSRQSTP